MTLPVMLRIEKYEKMIEQDWCRWRWEN